MERTGPVTAERDSELENRFDAFVARQHAEAAGPPDSVRRPAPTEPSRVTRRAASSAAFTILIAGSAVAAAALLAGPLPAVVIAVALGLIGLLHRAERRRRRQRARMHEHERQNANWRLVKYRQIAKLSCGGWRPTPLANLCRGAQASVDTVICDHRTLPTIDFPRVRIPRLPMPPVLRSLAPRPLHR